MRRLAPVLCHCGARFGYWFSDVIQGVGAQILLVAPFNTTPDELDALEVTLIAKLAKNSFSEVGRHIEEPNFSVIELHLELVAQTCLDMGDLRCHCSYLRGSILPPEF